MNRCDKCKWFTEGVTEEQRHKWNYSNWGRWCDGVCHLDFPRGYIARKAPHPALSNGNCFQFEEKDGQIKLEE